MTHGDRAASCRPVLYSLPLPGRVPLVHPETLLQNVTRSGYNCELVQYRPKILRGMVRKNNSDQALPHTLSLFPLISTS
jgi:hypothetical protein